MQTEAETTPRREGLRRRLRDALIVYVAALAVFGAVSYDRLLSHSFDNHYVYLADALIHGRLSIEGRPPHLNDWAKYEGKWYVSFPPAPALLMLPGVAVFGLQFNDRLFTLFFAALGPALLCLLIGLLVDAGRLARSRREILLLCGLFGVGTVYFFAAVQGSVWYTAHVVGGVFLLLFAIASLDGRRPLLAGLWLGLAFACRPPMLLAFPFFLYELVRPCAPADEGTLAGFLREAWRSIPWKRLLGRAALFGLPIAAVIGLLMWMNYTRFDDPFEFGHMHLQVRWTARIERWGLFHYHFLTRNLMVSLALLPWLKDTAPYIGVSRHGLALWFTTPFLLWVLWPRVRTRFYTVLAITTAAVAAPSLLYQNSGWVQFGYRFALDFAPFLFLMLAAGRRRFGWLFLAAAAFAVAVNLFGAITFDRMMEFYPGESTQTYYQPD